MFLFFSHEELLQLHQGLPCLCKSQTWAQPSSRRSSSTLLWPTLSWSTCACWISTPCPPLHATPASSAPSVGPTYVFAFTQTLTDREGSCVIHLKEHLVKIHHRHCISEMWFFFAINIYCVTTVWNVKSGPVSTTTYRASVSISGNPEGDDQVWNEHRSLKLLPRHTRGGSSYIWDMLAFSSVVTLLYFCPLTTWSL